jgi:hypothetical protein
VLAAEEPVPAPGLALDTLAALDRHVPVAPPTPPTVDLDDQRTAAPAMAGWAADETRPGRLRDAVPSGEVFEAGLRTLLTGEAPGSVPAEPDEARTDGPDVAATAVADLQPLPSPDRQALLRRVPGASGGGQAATSSSERARRSPDEVREILMKYRSGLQAGRAATPGREERP